MSYPAASAHRRPSMIVALAVSTVILAGSLVTARVATALGEQTPASAQSPDTQVEAAYQFALAKLLAEEGSYDQALEAYDRALGLDGAAVYARLELAQLHLLLAQISRNRQGRAEHLDAAAEQAEAARRLAPESSDTLRTYGQVELQLAERDPAAADRAIEALAALRQRGEADLQVLTSLGQIYLWQQRPREAVEVLQEAVDSLPGHRTLNKMLLQALVQADEVERAEGVLRQLVVLEPEAPENWLQLADVLSRQSKHAAAVEALRQAPEEAREQPELRQSLATELHLTGEHRAALVETDALLAEAPERDSLRRLRVQILSSLLRYDDAIAELHQILARTGQPAGSDVDLVLSRLLERVGRVPEAVEVLRASLARDGGQDALRVRLALVGVLERSGQLEAAAELVREALSDAAVASLPLLARTLSDLLTRTGRAEEAQATLENAATRLKSAGEAETADRLQLARWALVGEQSRWQELAEGTRSLMAAGGLELRLGARLLHAEALAELGQLEQASKVLQEEGLEPRYARQLDAKRAELLLRFGRPEQGRAAVAELVGQGGAELLAAGAQVFQRAGFFEDMLALAGRSRELEPDSVRALFLYGSASERTGRLDAATEAFERLLTLEPDYAPALNYLGYLWADRGVKLDSARQMIEKAVALEPDNGAYVDSLGWVYFRLGRYPESRRFLEWAVRLLPEDATVWEHLGDLHAAVAEPELARRAYEKALELGADEPERTRVKLDALATPGS